MDYSLTLSTKASIVKPIKYQRRVKSVMRPGVSAMCVGLIHVQVTSSAERSRTNCLACLPLSLHLTMVEDEECMSSGQS